MQAPSQQNNVPSDMLSMDIGDGLMSGVMNQDVYDTLTERNVGKRFRQGAQRHTDNTQDSQLAPGRPEHPSDYPFHNVDHQPEYAIVEPDASLFNTDTQLIQAHSSKGESLEPGRSKPLGSKRKLSSGFPGKKKCPQCGSLSGVRSFKCSNQDCGRPFYSDAELQAMPGSQKQHNKCQAAVTTFKVMAPNNSRQSIPGCSKFKIQAPPGFSGLGDDVRDDGLSVVPSSQPPMVPQSLLNAMQLPGMFGDQGINKTVPFLLPPESELQIQNRLKKRSSAGASGTPGKKKCGHCGCLSGVRALKCSTCSRPFYTDDELLAMPKLGKQRRLHVSKMKPIDAHDSTHPLEQMDPSGMVAPGLPSGIPATMLPPGMLPEMGDDPSYGEPPGEGNNIVPVL
eukprot:TRINITY_DN16559_c0_g1_i12.p1 TRINITY_DN16559_c0_g1~~TRINITY_DN16559_c0_g1_i12.p1  ORF type:complete len:395 (-),score=91.57 TRINITY_DN16559_c0_g1_i12:544-1728(-)